MIGKDSSPQSLGVVPCTISWLFRLLGERRDRTGTRFSVRVSAVELCGRDQSLRDLLAEVASGGLQDTQSPGVHLREDPVCGAQVRLGLGRGQGARGGRGSLGPVASPSAFSCRTRVSSGRLRPSGLPPTWTQHWLLVVQAGRAAARRPGMVHTCSSHCMSTSTVWRSGARRQVSPAPVGVLGWRIHGGRSSLPCAALPVSGGRSRLHLLDLGSCETVSSRAGESSGGSLDLSLPALGSVILALVSGAKHVPYRWVWTPGSPWQGWGWVLPGGTAPGATCTGLSLGVPSCHRQGPQAQPAAP